MGLRAPAPEAEDLHSKLVSAVLLCGRNWANYVFHVLICKIGKQKYLHRILERIPCVNREKPCIRVPELSQFKKGEKL